MGRNPIALRWGSSFTDNNATRTTGEAIASYLENHPEMMDIDGNNEIEAAVDGLLAYGYLNIRSLPPFLRDSLTQQLADNLITDENASRTTGEEISAFMNQFII